MKGILCTIFCFTLSFAAYLWAAVPENIAEKYNLEYRMPDGSGFILTNSIGDHYTRKVMGNEITVNARDIVEYAFGIKSSGAQGLILEFRYNNRTHETDDPQSPANADFARLLGKKAGFGILLKGDLSDFTSFDALPVIEIPDQQDFIGEQRYINEIRGIFPKLPDSPIGLGDTWSYTQQYDEPMQDGNLSFTFDYAYKLLEKAKREGIDCLKIEGKYTTSIEGKIAAGGMEFTINLAGEGRETMYFAHKEGMFLLREGNSFYEGSAESENFGLSIPMRHEYESSISVTLNTPYDFTAKDDVSIEQVDGEEYPNAPDDYYGHGEAYLSSGDFQKAIENFRKAFESSNYNPAIWNKLGEAYSN